MIAASIVPAVGRSRGRRAVSGGALLVIATASLGTTGCSHGRTSSGTVTPYVRSMTIAVAPALNFSGSSGIDPVRLGDLMASELSQVAGIQVVGVNRVMAVLARQGRENIGSPAHALEVCHELGVDAILVFAITEYDPYMPPVVGLAAQLYGPRPQELGFDPVATSRQARPFGIGSAEDESLRPWAQVQQTFNAAHESVQKAVEHYGRTRDAEQSPLGWRKYLASQELYVRFCCHSAISELMRREADRVTSECVAFGESSR